MSREQEQEIRNCKQDLQQLQQTCIKVCLQVCKPQFKVKEFIYFQQGVDQDNPSIISKGNFAHVKIYDEEKQKFKILIVCLSEDAIHFRIFYQKVSQRSVRNDIILNIEYQYPLDPDQIFYVFETEYIYSTLDLFEHVYELNKQLITQSIKQIQEYCNNSLNIFSSKQIQDYYVCFNDKNQLNIKTNLIDTYWKIKSYFEKNYESDLLNNNQEDNDFQSKRFFNRQMECEKENSVDLKYSFEEASQRVNEFLDSFNQIEKKDFLIKIQNQFSNMLQQHPLEIFEIIQTIPGCKKFEVISSNELEFQLKVLGRYETIIIKGLKLDSLSEAEDLISDYEQIIQNKQLSKNQTITNTQLLTTQNFYYVLVGHTFLDYKIRQENNFANLNNLSLQNSFKTQILLSFLKFSYELLMKHDLDITKVDPKNLLLLDKHQISDEYLRKSYFDLRDRYKELNKSVQIQSENEKNLESFTSKLDQLNVNNLKCQNIIQNRQEIKSNQMEIQIENNEIDQKIQRDKLEQCCDANQKYEKEMLNNNLQIYPKDDEDLIIKQDLKTKDIEFTIDEVTFYDFSTEYTKIIGKCLVKDNNWDYMDSEFHDNYEKGMFNKYFTLFFQKISENQKEEVEFIFNQLLIGFDILFTVSNSGSYYSKQYLNISSNDFTRLKIKIENSGSNLYLIEQFLRVHKHIKICSLFISGNEFQNFRDSIFINDENNYYDYDCYKQEVYLLKQFFLNYNNNQKISHFKQELIDFLGQKVDKNTQIKLFKIKPDQLNVSQIVNINILDQNHLKLINQNQFQILVLKLIGKKTGYYNQEQFLFLKIMIIDNQIFYMIGNEFHILVNQNQTLSIKEIIRLELELETILYYFSPKYIYNFKHEKLVDFQTILFKELKDLKKLTLYYLDDFTSSFNFQSCKQITELNLELYYIGQSHQYLLDKLIKQINLTQVKKILVSNTVTSYYSDEYCKPKINSFYHLKNLVSIDISEIGLDEEDFDIDSQDGNNDKRETYLKEFILNKKRPF